MATEHHDPELQRTCIGEPDCRTFAHPVRAIKRNSEPFPLRDGLDIVRFKFAISGMNGGERRLLSAALARFTGWHDPAEHGLDPLRLDERVCNLGSGLNQALERAMRLRRVYHLNGA